MDKNKIEEMLEEQKRLGHPNFKNKIVALLVENLEIDLDIAEKTVFNSDIENRIDKDMNWSQHMGPEYWVKTIIENKLIYKINKQ